VTASRELVAYLGPGGALARALPGYEHREDQLAMAGKVADALSARRYLVAEAGTGTGKTLAYLLPAALSGRRVIVSTATKTLQEQIWTKDLPLLAEKLGVHVEAAYLKGRANYYCKERGARFAERPAFALREEAAAWPEIQRWARTTETGDRGELDLPDAYAAWRELSATGDTCLGKECPEYEECFVTRARAKAARARIVLVNHHLFFADLAMRTSRAGVEVLPEYDAVIFDEAHVIEDVATEYFGLMVSSYRVDELGRDAERAVADRPDLAKLVRERTAELAKASDRFFDGVAAGLARSSSGRPSPYQGEGGVQGGLGIRPNSRSSPYRGAGGVQGELGGRPSSRSSPYQGAGGVQGGLWKGAATRDLFPPARAARAGERAGGDSRAELTPGMLEPLEDDQARLDAALEDVRELFVDEASGPTAALGRRAAELRSELAAVTAMKEPSRVFFGEVRGRGVFLRAAPISVAEELVSRLYRRVDTVVFTSATLAAGGRFDYFRREVGLAPELDVEEAIFPGPFDYRRQAALVVPQDLPEPAHPDFFAAAAEAVRALTAVTGGRAFVLSTSLRGMKALHEALRNLPYQVLLQGDRPKGKLLELFRAEPSVLFATQSFWEGVDVPGEALSLVVIDKLPFAPPGDPVVAARTRALEAAGRDAFAELSVPSAALSLKQGFGRLVRTRQDRGIVAVLDRRLLTKGYGRTFLATLPPAPLLRSVDEARRWWGNGKALA
jgi:ATP-dependent DNA helicase DinG